MKTVGPDRRPNYYQQSVNEVIAALNSHKLGLTNAEAWRRLNQHGQNTLHLTDQTFSLLQVLRQFQNLFVAMMLAAAYLALYLNETSAAAAFAAVTVLAVVFNFKRERGHNNFKAEVSKLLSQRTRVLRSGLVRQIETSSLVLGDIVYLEMDDLVPADLRLLSEKNVRLDESALFSGHGHVSKFTHTIAGHVALTDRHNLAFMGSRIISGKAHGIVTATGMHTELGRVLALAEAAKQPTQSPITRDLNYLAARLVPAAATLGVMASLLLLDNGLDGKSSVLAALAIAASLAPSGLWPELYFMLARSANRLKALGIRVTKLSALNMVANTNIILADEAMLFNGNKLAATELAVGRATYFIGGNGYKPSGVIRNAEQKIVNQNELTKLSLIFAAGALVSTAKVCQPDAQHNEWYALGSPTDAALTTLARKAGLRTEELDEAYAKLAHFSFDTSRQLTSTARLYKDETYVFVKGSPAVVMARCKKLWDHGHVRNFTAGDETYFTNYEAKAPGQAVALAYRVLPGVTNTKKLTMQATEQSLVFLGLISLESPLHMAATQALADASKLGFQVSFLSASSANKVQLARSFNVGKIVSSSELHALSDGDILQLLERGEVVFDKLSPEDKLRLVEVSKAAGNVTMLTGQSLSDIPALLRADVGVANNETLADMADISVFDGNFHHLVQIAEAGRQSTRNIRVVIHSSLTDMATASAVVAISVAGQLVFRVPFAITAIQILAIGVVLQLLPTTALAADKPSAHNSKHPTFSPIVAREPLMFGLLAGAIAYGNFWLFFVRQNLSPMFIDASSKLYMQAASITTLTLLFCAWINLIFARAGAHHRLFSKQTWQNRRLFAGVSLSFVAALFMIYNRTLSSFFGLHALDLSDWLFIVLASSLYACLRCLQRYTRRHSRHAVIKLHQDTFGKTLAAKV